MAKSLRELGAPALTIDDFLGKYHNVVITEGTRSSKIERIRNLLQRIAITEEEHWLERIKLPLYRFGAPRVRGASARFVESTSWTHTERWFIRMFGVGTGDTKETFVERVGDFHADAGHCKQVYVPVELRVARVRVTHADGRTSRGIRAELWIPPGKTEWVVRGRGVYKIRAEKCRQREAGVEESPIIREFSGDNSGAIHTISETWRLDVAREVHAQLKKALEVTAVARVKRSSEMKLSLNLPAGYDYAAFASKSALRWHRP